MKRLIVLASIVAFGSALAAYRAPQAPAPTSTAAELDACYKNERVKAAIQVIYDESK